MQPEHTDYDPFAMTDEQRQRIEQIDSRLDDLDQLQKHLLEERSRLFDQVADD